MGRPTGRRKEKHGLRVKHCIGTKIADNAVATEHITDLAVTTAKLAADAVDIPVLANSAGGKNGCVNSM